MGHIHERVRQGDAAAVRRAIASGEDVDAFDDDFITPMQLACELGHTEIVRLLLEAGAGMGEALNGAIAGHHVEIVRLFLQHGLDPRGRTDEEGATHLMFAASVGDLAIVKLLVEAGADVNATMRDQESALSLAASQGHQAVVEYLLPLCDETVRRQAGY